MMAKPVFVITGPSGAGKGTLIRELVERVPELEVAVSATTRPRRPDEEDAREYHFFSEQEFVQRIGDDEFLEYVQYVGGRYGTLRSEIDRIAADGKVCVLELEIEGALKVEEQVAGSVTTLNVNGADLFYNSATGLRQDGGTTGTWDAVQTHGNATGFEIGGTITITNARVFENVGTGVSSGGTATVQTSEIFGNATGIVLNNGSISASRIYGNVGTGVQASFAPITLSGNTIYSNDIGLFASAFINAPFNITNNLFYANRTAAVRLTSPQPSAYEIVNNTIFEPTADGIRATVGGTCVPVLEGEISL